MSFLSLYNTYQNEKLHLQEMHKSFIICLNYILQKNRREMVLTPRRYKIKGNKIILMRFRYACSARKYKINLQVARNSTARQIYSVK